MITLKDLLEDVYAADRKEKQWIDPATGKTKKRRIQAHRIQFAASKLHKGQDDKDAIPDYLKTEEVMEDDLKTELHEVLSKDAKAGDWIHDFVHSTNPKFAGKSKKERIQMALGAYYAKQHNEEVELTEDQHDPYWRAQENKHSAEAAHKQGDHLAYHLHMADHHDDLAHWHQLRGRNNVSDLHLNKAEYHAHLANELLHKEKHGIKEAFNVWSIKNTKTGQVYKYSKYPIDKNDSTLKQIRNAGGDHIHATPHKDGEPVNEEAIRIVDPIRKKVGDVNYGKKDGSFQGSMERKQLARAAIDRRKVTAGSGVSGFNSKMIKPKSTTETGRVRAVREENELDEALTAKTSAPTAQATGVNAKPKSTEAKSTKTSFKVETPWVHSQTTTGNVTDKSGHTHTPYSRARHLARQALQKMQEDNYKGLEKEPKKGLPTAVIKTSKTAVKSDTVEGWDHPHDAVKKEETSMITYKDFVDLLEGMTATSVRPGVTRYTGGSYGNAKGARYGNTDYDKETLDTKDDEGGEAQVKRGRGRPAGSKSGARGPRIK